MPVLRMSDKGIASLAPPQRGQLDYYDDVSGAGAVRGLILKISHGGTRSFYLLIRQPGIKGSRQLKLGTYPALRLAAARKKALKLKSDLEADPRHLQNEKARERGAKTFKTIADDFHLLHIKANKLRTGHVMWQQIEKHLMPKLKDRPFSAIRRDELASLLDDVQKRHGLAMRARVYTVFASIATFYLQSDENYRSPLISSMRRYKARKRKRALKSDAELRAFWNATAQLGTFGALSRTALLTGVRRTKVNLMRWEDINKGVWTLEFEADNEKKNVGAIRLPPLALSIIQAQPRLEKNPYVFTASRGRGAFAMFAPMQKKLIKLMREELPGMQPFVFHDLRRSMRTLASRIGIERDLAERMIGHTVGNELDEIYDQHEFFEEIAGGLAKIADHMAAITTPPVGNVVRIKRRPSSASGVAALSRNGGHPPGTPKERPLPLR